MNIPSNMNPLGVYQPLPPPGYEWMKAGVLFSRKGASTNNSSGTVFDVGLTLQNRMRLRLELEMLYENWGEAHPFGTQPDKTPEFCGFLNSEVFFTAHAQKQSIPADFAAQKRFVIELSCCGGEGEFTVNGKSRLFDFSPQNTESIYLGASNRTTKVYYGHGRPMPMRFFRMEFWQFGQKIAEMLPVKNPATGDLQIWDACRKRFLAKLYGELEEPTDEI